jgi:hypothetical protein
MIIRAQDRSHTFCNKLIIMPALAHLLEQGIGFLGSVTGNSLIIWVTAYKQSKEDCVQCSSLPLI